MQLIRATSLNGVEDLLTELGADAAAVLGSAGIDGRDIGQLEVFFPLRNAVQAVENAAAVTNTPDFGRRLALRQGFEILGPVGLAAKTAASVADVFLVFGKFVAAYSPGIAIDIQALDDASYNFVEWRLRLDPSPPHAQTIELSLGIMLGVLRGFLGPDYAPVSVHVPHRLLSPAADYRRYFGCSVRDQAAAAGFVVRAQDLAKPLPQDIVTHHTALGYLTSTPTDDASSVARAVADVVRPLLPSGAVTIDLVAQHFMLHPKALQRRLAAEGTNFAGVLDSVRREAAVRYLRDTDISLTHLSHQLGYAEQSVLSRACQRWFGRGPLAQRTALRTTNRPRPRRR